MEFTYTTVITRNGNSYPTGGCHIIQVQTGRDTYANELRIISPAGSEFTIARQNLGAVHNDPISGRLLYDRKVIVDAIKKGLRVIELQDFPDSPVESLEIARASQLSTGP